MQLKPAPVGTVAARGAIERLQAAAAQFPQAEGLVTEHYFSNGMYCRKMQLPAGLLIVGKRHLHDHFFILCSGRMVVSDENGSQHLSAGDVICSKAGTKRALLCITECIGMNVHRVSSEDLDEIEKELVEPDDTALFDGVNRLKKAPLTCI